MQKQAARYYNVKVKPSTIKEDALILRKNEASRVESNRKLDSTWEASYRVKTMVTGVTNCKDMEQLKHSEIFSLEVISYNTKLYLNIFQI